MNMNRGEGRMLRLMISPLKGKAGVRFLIPNFSWKNDLKRTSKISRNGSVVAVSQQKKQDSRGGDVKQTVKLPGHVHPSHVQLR